MATSRRPTRVRVIGVAAVLLAVAPIVLVSGGGRARVASRGAPFAPFAWLHPGRAPSAWRRVTTATSGATLFYPPTWKKIPGDTGTVTVSLREGRLYAGYLNVTPRQGAEQQHDWAAFRIRRNRTEGDGHVRQVAAAEALRFRRARGSCVIDDYLSRVESHAYREIACIVSGARHTDVFIGAALRSDWSALSGSLERAASSLVQR